MLKMDSAVSANTSILLSVTPTQLRELANNMERAAQKVEKHEMVTCVVNNSITLVYAPDKIDKKLSNGAFKSSTEAEEDSNRLHKNLVNQALTNRLDLI